MNYRNTFLWQKKSRTIYKSMTPPACRPRPKRKSNKYNLTICYKAKNRCQGGKNSHYSPMSLSSALRRRAKVAHSGVQIETPKSISFKDGKYKLTWNFFSYHLMEMI